MDLGGVFGLSPRTAVVNERNERVYPSTTYETFHARRYDGKFKSAKPQPKTPKSFEASVIKFKMGFGGGQIQTARKTNSND
jgi:hypothetical protein